MILKNSRGHLFLTVSMTTSMEFPSKVITFLVFNVLCTALFSLIMISFTGQLVVTSASASEPREYEMLEIAQVIESFCTNF